MPQPYPRKFTVVTNFGRRYLAQAQLVQAIDNAFGVALPIDLGTTPESDTASLAQVIPGLIIQSMGQNQLVAPRGGGKPILSEPSTNWANGTGAILYFNAASHNADSGEPRHDNQGGQLLASYHDGLLIVGPDIGYSWALAAQYLETIGVSIHEIDVKNDRLNRFPSPDCYPEVIRHLWDGLHWKWEKGLDGYRTVDTRPFHERLGPMFEEIENKQKPLIEQGPLIDMYQAIDPAIRESIIAQLSRGSDPRVPRTYLISDYSDERRSIREARQPSSPFTIDINVNSGDTTAAAFCAAQLALNGTGSVVIVDVDTGRRTGVAASRLPNGVLVFGPDEPSVWIYLAQAGARVVPVLDPSIEDVHVAAGILLGDPWEMARSVAKEPRNIQPRTGTHVGYIDAHGNVTVVNGERFPPGTEVLIRFGSEDFAGEWAGELQATASEKPLAVPVGKDVYGPESVSWSTLDGLPVTVHKVSRRGGNAADASENKKTELGYFAGAKVEIEALERNLDNKSVPITVSDGTETLGIA